MTAHPSDQAVAQLIRNARVGAAASGFPTRTRTVGEGSARQCSVGRLVMEAARADAGVSDEVAAARREVIAAELERRRLEEAAAEVRRIAERDVQHAEAERDDAVARARRMGGPNPDFLTLALIAAATSEIADTNLIHVIDEALTDNADLTPVDRGVLAGEPMVGLTPAELTRELEQAGVSPETAAGLPSPTTANTTPSELVSQSVMIDSAPVVTETVTTVTAEIESPEVGG